MDRIEAADAAGQPRPRMLLLLNAVNQRVWYKLPAVRAALVDGHSRLHVCVIVMGQNIKQINTYTREHCTHILAAETQNADMLKQMRIDTQMKLHSTQGAFNAMFSACTQNYSCALWKRNDTQGSQLRRLKPDFDAWITFRDTIAGNSDLRLGAREFSNYPELVANAACIAAQSPWELLLRDFGDDA
jgi:hypothetical protein